MMKKIKKIRNGLFASLALALLSLQAETPQGPVQTSFSPVVLSSLDGIKWVKKCIEQYPEIAWLAANNVRKTEEGQAVLQGSYSEYLFNQKYIEFDRTLMTLHCLRLILDGSDQAYQKFTAAQPQDVKLSRESFKNLHLQGQRLLKSQWEGLSELQMAQVMETALILSDMGKSEYAREIFKSLGACAPDHDDFYGEVMENIEKRPELSPSFTRLPTPAKQLLIKIANLAHYGHVTHLEGGASMFSKLKQSNLASTDPVALSFDFFAHLCDVAGALGHVNNQASLMYTELTHRALQATEEAIKTFADPAKTEEDAYNTYLATRASWLGLNPENRSEHMLARIGAMLRLFTPQEGSILKQALSQLDENTRNKIIDQLDIQKDDPLIRTPTYMPTVLNNLSNNLQLGATKEARLSKAVTLGLPMIAKVLEKERELLRKKEVDATIPLNFNSVAGIAKISPDLLTQEFSIDKDGKVYHEKMPR